MLVNRTLSICEYTKVLIHVRKITSTGLLFISRLRSLEVAAKLFLLDVCISIKDSKLII